LRPQLMDRFGLRALVRGLEEPDLRYQVYEHVVAHRRDPERFAAAFAQYTLALAEEVQAARQLLPDVRVGDAARALGLRLVNALQIESNRAELTLFEAARAHAAADERTEVLPADVEAVSLLALRLRRSEFLTQFFAEQAGEDAQVGRFWEQQRAEAPR
ncbi:MAG: hypothetical protein KC425_02925, partial [Anaerolineales bacterium]|nr:hypothetical protein [Anaerolineales bacterium]